MSVKKNVLFAKKGMSLEFLSNSHSISIIIPRPPPKKKNRFQNSYLSCFLDFKALSTILSVLFIRSHITFSLRKSSNSIFSFQFVNYLLLRESI